MMADPLPSEHPKRHGESLTSGGKRSWCLAIISRRGSLSAVTIKQTILPGGKLRVRLEQGVCYLNNNRIIQFPKQNEFGGVAARAAMLPHVTSAREAPPLHQLP